MNEALDELAAHIAERCSEAVDASATVRGELVITARRDRLRDLLRFLRDDSQCLFQTLVDITAVDWPGRPLRFEMVYHFLSMRLNHRVRVKFGVAEGGIVPSVVELFPGANWYEREVFDMYGVVFDGHPDLRRILTDYGFEGFPLRKEFPLTGHVEVRYDALEKRVAYEPVKLVQEYRNFDFLSPWEGMTAAIPGDEKARGG
jgi:NADH-quinone oxidoreductase subunit C